MYKIAICEDEEVWSDQLISVLNNIHINGELKIDSFSSGEALLKSCSKKKYDLIFLDIYMSGINGVEVASAIRKSDKNICLVFTTTSPDHALEAYRLDVMKYLEKPIKEQDVRDCIALMQMKKNCNREITIMVAGRERSFTEDRIAYFEQCNHTIHIFFTDRTEISFTGKLDEFQNDLPNPPFYRCHKSFLVNLAQVSMLNKSLLVFEMKNNDNVYIRRANLKEAAAALDEYLFCSIRK